MSQANLLKSVAQQHGKKLAPILEEHLKTVEQNREKAKELAKQEQAAALEKRRNEREQAKKRNQKKNYTWIMIAVSIVLLAYLYWNFKSELHKLIDQQESIVKRTLQEQLKKVSSAASSSSSSSPSAAEQN